MLQGVPFNALGLPEPGASGFCKELLRWPGMTPALLSFISQAPTWPHLPLCLGPALCLACWGGVLALASPSLDSERPLSTLGYIHGREAPHTCSCPGRDTPMPSGPQEPGKEGAVGPVLLVDSAVLSRGAALGDHPSQPPGGTDGLLINLLSFKIFWLHCTRLLGSEITEQGPNLCPLLWKYGALTTGLPGESQGLMVLGLQVGQAGIDVVSKTL